MPEPSRDLCILSEWSVVAKTNEIGSYGWLGSGPGDHSSVRCLQHGRRRVEPASLVSSPIIVPHSLQSLLRPGSAQKIFHHHQPATNILETLLMITRVCAPSQPLVWYSIRTETAAEESTVIMVAVIVTFLLVIVLTFIILIILFGDNNHQNDKVP